VENESASQSDVPNPEDYTLVLEANNRFQAQVDCNKVQGSYIIDGDEIYFELGPTTLAECGPESLYNQFLELLSKVESFGIRADELVLVLGSDDGEMGFQNGGSAGGSSDLPTDLINVQWMWSEMRETSPAAQSLVADPANYTITFRERGVLNVRADCNAANGAYTTDGENIQIELGAMTLAYCGGDSLSDQFIQFLSAAETFNIGGDGLLLHLEEDTGSMKFISS
jgi:heat shock protein HslJ